MLAASADHTTCYRAELQPMKHQRQNYEKTLLLYNTSYLDVQMKKAWQNSFPL
jgi:hypothetical protein